MYYSSRNKNRFVKTTDFLKVCHSFLSLSSPGVSIDGAEVSPSPRLL
jgi:hypothetical protein